MHLHPSECTWCTDKGNDKVLVPWCLEGCEAWSSFVFMRQTTTVLFWFYGCLLTQMKNCYALHYILMGGYVFEIHELIMEREKAETHLSMQSQWDEQVFVCGSSTHLTSTTWMNLVKLLSIVLTDCNAHYLIKLEIWKAVWKPSLILCFPPAEWSLCQVSKRERPALLRRVQAQDMQGGDRGPKQLVAMHQENLPRESQADCGGNNLSGTAQP